MLGRENHTIQTVISQILLLICWTPPGKHLLSHFCPLPPNNHFATSGTDRTALMCDGGDRVALHAADSLTRIACERAENMRLPMNMYVAYHSCLGTGV